MDFSVTRQLTSKIPDKVSTEQIKAGLQRIKKAQEQVLLQLKRNHPDYSIDVRTNSQVLNQRKQQNQHLKTELNVERERSTEKSTLYRRRVVDLENSLALHEQNQYKLRNQNRILDEQIRNFKIKYSDLEKDYQKLVQQSQVSNKNVRNLEKQVMDLMKKLQQEDVSKLRLQFANLTAQRNSIMTQKVNLLKTSSKLQSQNIELKQKIKTLISDLSKKQRSAPSASASRSQDITTILNQIDKMNLAHEYIFSVLRSNTRLPKAIIDKQNQYQNSLNKILEMLQFMQKGAIGTDGLNYRFDHEESFRVELQRMENQFGKKYKRDMARQQGDKDQLEAKIKARDRKIQEMQTQNQQLQLKVSELRKQKSDLLQQITDLSRQISIVKQSKQKQDAKKMQDQMKKQKNKDEQYRAIILQLNQQMEVIQKQKKDLDNLIGKMAQSRSQQELRNKKRMSEIEDANQSLKIQNQRLKAKYQGTMVQKQHMQLALQQSSTKTTTLNKEIARQILQKQKILSQLTRLKQQNEINQAEVQKYKLQSDNIKKQSQNINNSYLLEIERLIKEGLQLRQQIQVLLQDRNQLREMKGKYGLLLKDNQILGKKARYVNSQLDHLWMIKEVQYQNLNKVLSDLKPL